MLRGLLAGPRRAVSKTNLVWGLRRWKSRSSKSASYNARQVPRGCSLTCPSPGRSLHLRLDALTVQIGPHVVLGKHQAPPNAEIGEVAAQDKQASRAGRHVHA